MRTAIALLATLVWFVLFAYLFALAGRHDVIGECLERATGDQAALCKSLPRNPPLFH